MRRLRLQTSRFQDVSAVCGAFVATAVAYSRRCAPGWLIAALIGGGMALGQGSIPPAPASPNALTLQQVVELARTKNPSLLAAQQNLLSVKAQEIQAGVRQNPNFTAYGSNLSNPASAATPYGYSLQVSRLFERGEKRRWRLDTAKSTTDQTRDQYVLQEQQTILAVKQAFTSMILAKAALKLAQDNLKDYRHELDISKARYDAGDIGKLDYERLDLQLAQFETDESSAEATLSQTSYQLQNWIGLDHPGNNFDIVGDIVPPVVSSSLVELEQKALAARPDYKAAQDGIRVADANVKLAYANGTTDPTLEGEYDHNGTLSSYGFYASIPIRIFDRNQGNKETANLSRRRAVSPRSRRATRSIRMWIKRTLATPLPRPSPTGTTAIILTKPKTSCRSPSSPMNMAGSRCSTTSTPCRTTAPPR
jgi:cobalt-zinc-cadmium efflux system outer membrane protein